MAIGFRPPIGLALLLLSCGSPAGELPDLDLHRGRNALAMARHDWARVYFAADLEPNPDRPESWRGLGLSWIAGAEGSLSKAIDSFERYLELEPGDHDVRLRLARAWFRMGDTERALAALDGLPESAAVHLLAARIHLDRDPEIAASEVAEAIAAAPDELGPHFLAARIYFRLGNHPRAASSATRALEVDPLHAEAHYLLASALRRQGEAERSRRALETYERLQRLRSPGLAPREELALLRGFQQDPAARSLGFRLRLARLLLETGQLEQATPLLRELAADPGSQAQDLFELAQRVHARGRVLLARDLYSEVLHQRPGHLGALAQQAQLAYASGELAEARRLLEIGFSQDRYYAPFHYLRGMIALSERRDDDAGRALRAAVDLAPWLARYRIALADVLLARGDRAAFDRLLAEAPSDPDVDAYRRRHARSETRIPSDRARRDPGVE